MGRADTYVQPDAPDPVLEPDTVLTLARLHCPDVATVTAVDESGGEARAYMLDDDVVVKTQRPHRLRPRTSLAKEAHLLDRLAGTALAGRIPRLYGYDTVGTRQGPVEYLCMSRIPGCAVLNAAPLRDADRESMLVDLAAILRIVHDLDTAAAVASGRFPTDADAAGLRNRLRLGFADLGDALTDDPGAWTLPIPVEDVADRSLTALPATLRQPPVVLHSNPGRTHTFVDPATGALTGLIDFGDSYLSHPAMDLRSWPDPADRQVLRDAYLDGHDSGAEFDRVWTVAMIYTDVNVIASRSPHAAAAAADLTGRLSQL